MQQTAIYEISEEYHAELHRKGIPHKNVTNKYWNKPHVEIVLEFDEELAAELFPLTAEHEYRISNGVRVPRTDTAGNFEFFYADFTQTIRNATVEPISTVLDVHDYVKKLIEDTYYNVININHILDIIKHRHDQWPAANAQAAILEEQRKKLYAEQEARYIEESKQKDEQQRAQRKEAEAKEAELLVKQLAWIKEHGSDRLKKSFEKNYKCKKLYLLERLKHDVGNYVLDYDAKIERKDRSCPSMEALLEVERIEKIEGITEAKVVWLPYGTAIEDYNDASEGIEAKFFGYWIYSTEY